mmetsp:Transcript_5949/g.19071  ORF Transcript_5949/g.19071 Transcript_5949/m.19071 type:complete len:227 (-) Transcript_5949:1632-2312(-)
MAHTRERHDEVLRGDRPLPVPVEGHQGLPDGNHVEVDRCIHGLHDVLLQLWSQRVLPREGIEELEVVHSASPCDVAVDCDALEGIGIRRATAAFQCWAKALECSHHLVDLQEAVSRGVDILEPRGQQLRHGPLALLRVCWHQSPPGVVYHGRRHGPQLRHSPGLNLWVDRGDPCDGERHLQAPEHVPDGDLPSAGGLRLGALLPVHRDAPEERARLKAGDADAAAL